MISRYVVGVDRPRVARELGRRWHRRRVSLCLTGPAYFNARDDEGLSLEAISEVRRGSSSRVLQTCSNTLENCHL